MSNRATGRGGPARLPLRATVAAMVFAVAWGRAASALAAGGTTAPANPLPGLPSYGEALARMLVTLGVLVVGLVIVARLLPKLMRGGGRAASSKSIEVIARKPLEARKTLYVVKVFGQYFLLASSGDRVQALGDKPLDAEQVERYLAGDQSPPPPGRPPPRSFLDVLRGSEKREQG